MTQSLPCPPTIPGAVTVMTQAQYLASAPFLTVPATGGIFLFSSTAFSQPIFQFCGNPAMGDGWWFLNPPKLTSITEPPSVPPINPPSVVVTPEPGSLILLATGVVVLAALRRWVAR